MLSFKDLHAGKFIILFSCHLDFFIFSLSKILSEMPSGSKIKELIYTAKLDNGISFYQCSLQEFFSGDTSCMLSPIVRRMAKFLLRSGSEGIKLFSCSTRAQNFNS